MKIQISISVGELLDKISILQIKSQYTKNHYVINELHQLIDVAKANNVYDENFLNELLEVNFKLWLIEDKLRELEKLCIFNAEFISNARMVYIMNDKRAEIKKEINKHTDSELCEIKIYR